MGLKVSYKEASEAIDRGVETIRYWVKRGYVVGESGWVDLGQLLLFVDKQKNKPKGMVTVKEASKFLGVSDSAIRRYARMGFIKKHYVVGSPKIYLVSIDELLGVEEIIDDRISAQHEWAKAYGKERFAKHGMAIFNGKA